MITSKGTEWLNKLLFYKTGAMSFQEKEIPFDVLRKILNAATSCAWLGRWKLVVVKEKQNIARVVEVLQENNRKWQEGKSVQFLERWKLAPLIISFFIPKPTEAFQWVPSEQTRTFSVLEVGTAVQTIALIALTHGIGLHGIMGALLAGGGLREVLKIPEGYEIVYFGVMGYPKEEVEIQFPKLHDICFAEVWDNPFNAT